MPFRSMVRFMVKWAIASVPAFLILIVLGVRFWLGVAAMATCDFMDGSEDQRTYLQNGIHACQTTPLIGRGGNVVGMISTHWAPRRRT